MNEKWGEGTVRLTLTEQYRNMAEVVATCMHLIENAQLAAKAAGITPLVIPIRGGTDGCQLSFRGLPCPNLGTGGHGYHGPYEHITVEGMDLATDMVLEISKIICKIKTTTGKRDASPFLYYQCGLNPSPRTSFDSIVTKNAALSTSFTAFCTMCICLLLHAHITTCFSSFE